MIRRLTELLQKLPPCCASSEVAEFLIKNGVTVPPCRVGDKLYEIIESLDDEIPTFIEELTVTDIATKRIFCSAYCPAEDDICNEIPMEELGKTVFLTYEEARRVLDDKAKSSRWILQPEGGAVRTLRMIYVCSGCGASSLAGGTEKYCSECGARMDGGKGCST